MQSEEVKSIDIIEKKTHRPTKYPKLLQMIFYFGQGISKQNCNICANLNILKLHMKY